MNTFDTKFLAAFCITSFFAQFFDEFNKQHGITAEDSAVVLLEIIIIFGIFAVAGAISDRVLRKD
jgi:hypothetical protein